MCLLTAAGCVLGYCALNAASVDSRVVALGIAFVTLLQFIRKRPRSRLPVPVWGLVLLPLYAALQLIPLPMGLVAVLSPARALLARAAAPALGAQPDYVPLSLAPSAGIDQFLRLAACVLLALIIREIAEAHARLWVAAIPIIVIAAAEAVFGCLQFYFGSGAATGTWPNRNHYANFLAMCLPFPLTYAVAVLRDSDRTERSRFVSAGCAAAALCIAATLFIGVMHSHSRMGFTAALFAVLVSGAILILASVRELGRFLAAGLLAGLFSAVVIAFFLLTPPQLLWRFTELEATGGIANQDRLQLWSESAALIRAYPLFGTGLGGYEPAFLTYKRTVPLVSDRFAHNDYLQYLIELGILGFALFATSAASVVWWSVRAARRSAAGEKYLAVACCGAFAAAMLHSAVEFNLYIAINMLALAWITGLASSLHPSYGAPVIRPGAVTMASSRRRSGVTPAVRLLTF